MESKTSVQILLQDIFWYKENQSYKNNERVAERNERLLAHANRVIDKLEIYLKVTEENNQKKIQGTKK